MTEETVKETAPQQVVPQPVPQITAGDVALMVKIVDAGAERGAWKGEEMTTIGNLRSKLVAIVRAVAPVEDSVETASDDEATTEVTEAVEEQPTETKKRKRGSKSAA